MAQLASKFRGDGMIVVYEKTAGLKADIRAEIVKRSGGDGGSIPCTASWANVL